MPSRALSADMFGRMLALAFVAVVGSFFASNLIVERSSAAVGGLAEDIIENTAPSIERLAQVRKSVLEAELSLLHIVEDPVVRPTMTTALDGAVRDAETNVRAYLALRPTAGEQSLMLEVQESWLQFAAAIAETRRLPSEPAQQAFTERVEPARRRILDCVTQVMEHNAVTGGEIASEIRRIRKRSATLANALNGLCAVLAALVSWLLYREARARRALIDAHLASVELRAAELEQFAARVAHDIRGPLAAARLAAEMGGRKSTDDAARALSERVMSSLSRADAITTALLDFARAGAKPDPGARTDVREVLADVGAELAPVAESADIELLVEPPPSAFAACSRGVYLSLVGNLVRNAIKYMGAVSERRVTVRVLDGPMWVRTEVTDTGPGIAEDALPALFEPYFRGQRGPEGLGLGLATVKKLAEGHGGRAGARSAVGAGSTFWFELPRA